MKYVYIITALLLLHSCANTNRLVDRIAKYNMVESERIEGWLGEKKSKQYQRYIKLSKRADANTLSKLQHHSNAVVRCYAGYALIDHEIKKPIEIFKPYIEDRTLVWHFRGTIFGQDRLSDLVYLRIWKKYLIYPNPDKVLNYELIDHPDLISLDSFLLYNSKSSERLINRALHNRVYPTEYNDRIIALGMKRLSYSALKYIQRNKLKVDSIRLEQILHEASAIREEQNKKELELIKEMLSGRKN